MQIYKSPAIPLNQPISGGEGGIRTHGADKPHNDFRRVAVWIVARLAAKRANRRVPEMSQLMSQHQTLWEWPRGTNHATGIFESHWSRSF